MEFIDHGDASVDERWRRMLSGRFFLPDEDDPHSAPEDFVPQQFSAEGRALTSLAICQAIPNGPGVV
jgi:hypothetical protein